MIHIAVSSGPFPIDQMRHIGQVCRFSLQTAFDGRILDPRAIVGALIEAMFSVMKDAQVDDAKTLAHSLVDSVALDRITAFSVSLLSETVH